MEAHRSNRVDWDSSELRDAARKTGRWLYYFHHRINTVTERPYTVNDILQEAREYTERIEAASRRRVRSQPILDAFSEKLSNLQIDRMEFSPSHLDMTTNNVLYSQEGKVCIIDMKNRLAPVYVDLGLILTNPETSKPQIFSAGTHFQEDMLRRYRAEIIAGYFDEKPGNERLVKIYGAIQVLNKWSMYEELMGKYKGLKKTLSFSAAPLVSGYFRKLLKKHLKRIGDGMTVPIS
jgi:thiamine kinase-like enzyme